MKKARALGLNSKVIDRHLFVNEERFTCGTIPERLKRAPWRLKSQRKLISASWNYVLTLSFIPRFFFLLYTIAFIKKKSIVQFHI